MKLTGNGLYRIGEDGKEYLYYKSKKHGIIIRDFFPEDPAAYYNTMVLPLERLNATQKNQVIKELEEIIAKRNIEEDVEYTLIVTSITGKIVGSIDVKTFDDGTSVIVKIYERKTKKNIGEEILGALKDMQQEFAWVDELHLYTSNGNFLVGKWLGSQKTQN